ncbi:Receptor-like protein kinase HERK 1 [Linum grandiflorum]
MLERSFSILVVVVVILLLEFIGQDGGALASYTPPDNYLIACGSSKDVTFQGRTFVPDAGHSSLTLKSGTSIVATSNSSSPSPLYQSARIFSGIATYNFDIKQQGRHWIRLYFYPIPTSTQNLTSASITVVTKDFVLLHDFTFKSYNGTYLFKEYSVNVTSDSLSLSFVPSNNSVAFVNAVEVVSIPDIVLPDQAWALNPSNSVGGLSDLAYETVYRLNMGGPLITSENDTLGRVWENDAEYRHVNNSAVDVNFNMTWVLPVNPNFRYLVRVHFCDIISRAMNNLVFNVFVNDDLALQSLDLSSITGGLAVPYYRDFISYSSTESDALMVSVGPDTMADITNATINGLEILKVSNDVKSLDGSQTMTKMSTTSQKSATASCISLASSNLGRFFPFQEILDATNKFDEGLLLGVGGFGRVYKGTLEDGTMLAVKRGNPRSEQGLAEFRTEIEMLSKLRHRHLVSLVGYCDERSEMILVYEYMANGPLRSHLYGTNLPSLSWKQRLEICIGAARGLHYLHTGAAQSIIHRDVKTTNILLDENLVAKVADFGLSKTGPSLDQTHVSTAVKGSFGYLDPEYFRRQQLTEKSDVYSFGVVLMEVLCTRPALNPVLPREQVNIAEWAMAWQKKGMLDQIMDQNLVGKVNPASLKKYGETAEKCLAEHGVDRPSMGDVLWNLEYALQLEETSSALMEPEDNSTNHIPGIPLTPLEQFDNSVSMIEAGHSGTDDDAEDATTSAVFSQLVNPRGR